MKEQRNTPAIELNEAHDGNKTSDFNTNKKWYIIIAVIIILLIVVWIWKSSEIGNLKNQSAIEIENTKKQAAIDRQTMQETTKRQIVQSYEAHLKLLAKPYVWAVRAEMMRGNINQVNLFANDMVKEKNFQRIVIANDKGIIVSSTNKKDEGQPFATVGKEAGLSGNNTTVENLDDSILVMTTPIMGFNNRLGTLLIKYAIQQPVF